MKFLPFQKFDVCVKLPPWEVCRRLLENIGGPSPFHGDVQEDVFKVYRNTIYSDPFLPRLHGVLEAIDGGTRIKINMKMYLPSKLWIAFCLTLIVGLSITGNLSYKSSALVLSFIFFITYVMLRFETRESKTAFLNFIESNIAANRKIT